MASQRTQKYRPKPSQRKGKPKAKPANKHPKNGITYSGQKTTHNTDGLKGYPAVDIFAKPGTPFLAPEKGRIVRISGHPGTTSGNVFGQSVYFQGVSGRTYFITHLGTVSSLGSYGKGDVLGTVSPWDSGSPHAHVGIHDGSYSGPTGDTTSGGAIPYRPGSQAPGSQSAGSPAVQAPAYADTTFVSGIAPPTDPGVPLAPMPELPGSVSVAPTDPSAAWREIGALPLISPETQRRLQLLGENV